MSFNYVLVKIRGKFTSQISLLFCLQLQAAAAMAGMAMTLEGLDTKNPEIIVDTAHGKQCRTHLHFSEMRNLSDLVLCKVLNKC